MGRAARGQPPRGAYGGSAFGNPFGYRIVPLEGDRPMLERLILILRRLRYKPERRYMRGARTR